MEDIIKIGTHVIIVKNGKVLLGKRKNSGGAGTYGLPGGHLEFNESPEECIKREVLEETNLKIKNIRFITYTNDLFKDTRRHYLNLHFIADYDSGELKNMEPEKCEKWEWVDWNNLPKPLFLPIENLLKKNINIFSIK